MFSSVGGGSTTSGEDCVSYVLRPLACVLSQIVMVVLYDFRFGGGSRFASFELLRAASCIAPRGIGGGGGMKGRKFLARSCRLMWRVLAGRSMLWAGSALEDDAWVIAVRRSSSSGVMCCSC